jgi:7-carboxy-7-deazaguanine synthase
MKQYAIREVFGTLQGEGANAGEPAVFLRFAGCNLGYDVCPWCDTDWAKAEHVLSVDEAVRFVCSVATETFGISGNGLLVVVTGGEPSLQFDAALSDALRSAGYRIAMETNGSRPIELSLVDWLTVSPKQVGFVQKVGHELKIVFTGSAAPGIAPSIESVRDLAASTAFERYYLQPLDLGPQRGSNYDETVGAVMQLGPPWRMSVQTHKIAGIR